VAEQGDDDARWGAPARREPVGVRYEVCRPRVGAMGHARGGKRSGWSGRSGASTSRSVEARHERSMRWQLSQGRSGRRRSEHEFRHHMRWPWSALRSGGRARCPPPAGDSSSSKRSNASFARSRCGRRLLLPTCRGLTVKAESVTSTRSAISSSSISFCPWMRRMGENITGHSDLSRQRTVTLWHVS
jgi:hypothetical protein